MRFKKDFPVQWADLDPNYHVRHSMFSKYASETRIAFFIYSKLMPDLLKAYNIGPVLFREEILYYNEVTLGETLSVNCIVTGMPENASKIDIKNEIFLGSSGKKAAIVHSTTMWLHLITRKLSKPPQEVVDAFTQLARADEDLVV